MVSYIGKVIRIVDEFTIIINTGAGFVAVGKEVQVYAETGEEIVDLDGTVLDTYSYIKDTLEVVQVEEKYSICKKRKTAPKTSNASIFAISPMLEYARPERTPLKIDASNLKPLPTADPIIHVGDKVKLKLG